MKKQFLKSTLSLLFVLSISLPSFSSSGRADDAGSFSGNQFALAMQDIINYLGSTSDGLSHLARHNINLKILKKSSYLPQSIFPLSGKELFDQKGRAADIVFDHEKKQYRFLKQIWDTRFNHCKPFHHLIYKEMLRATKVYNSIAEDLSVSNELLNMPWYTRKATPPFCPKESTYNKPVPGHQIDFSKCDLSPLEAKKKVSQFILENKEHFQKEHSTKGRLESFIKKVTQKGPQRVGNAKKEWNSGNHNRYEEPKYELHYFFKLKPYSWLEIPCDGQDVVIDFYED